MTLPVLCELVWVMSRAYKEPRERIAHAIPGLIATETVAVDHAAVEAGLAFLDAGGDLLTGSSLTRGNGSEARCLYVFTSGPSSFCRLVEKPHGH